MRSVEGVVAAIVAATVWYACPARAQSTATRGDDDHARLLLFASTDLWRHGGFVQGGVLWAPNGLDREGFALKLAFGGGGYRYTSGALGSLDVDGRQWSGEALWGWRFVRGPLFLTTFVGFDIQQHRLSPDDASAGLRGGHVGVRTGFELWYEPAPNAMLAAHAFGSTVGPSYNARFAVGWRVFEAAYVGPEVQGFAFDDNYKQLRTGLHVTALRLGGLEWSAGLGWAGDSDNRASLYGRVGLLTRR